MPRLLAYFARRVTPIEDAADCLSETLIIIWKKQATLPTDFDELRAWSFGVARNVLANQRRGQIRQSNLAQRLRDEMLTEQRPVSAASSRVEDALAGLRDKDRELVTMVVWDELSVAEAGSVLGLKPDAARARYSRARARLRVMLS